MMQNRRFLSYILFVTGVALLFGAGLYYFHTREPVTSGQAKNVPEILANLPMVRIVTGQEAINLIHQLHGNDFSLKDGTVATYGNQNATLWVSDAGSVSAASKLTELMSDRISAGNSPFSVLGDFELDGQTVHALDGMGQAHYYWQAGNMVIWLAVDVPVAQQAVIECVEFYK